MFAIAAALGGAAASNAVFVLVPLAMAVLGYFLFRHLAWDLADEVYDCGDSLLVRNRGQEAKISLSDIMNVTTRTTMNPPRVTLKLAVPTMLGSEVTFSPIRRFTLNPLAQFPLVDDLIVRIDRAKSSRGA